MSADRENPETGVRGPRKPDTSVRGLGECGGHVWAPAFDRGADPIVRSQPVVGGGSRIRDTPVRHVVVGTAGHIDHGKTSLVKALTGTDTDRLPEEKARGITIDLGFAFLEEPDGLVIEIVDVPGHERFVKNMLAGAGGIDLALLVVAADEGVMPQTREHLAICQLLRITSGLVVLSKADLAEPEWIELVRDDVRRRSPPPSSPAARSSPRR